MAQHPKYTENATNCVELWVQADTLSKKRVTIYLEKFAIRYVILQTFFSGDFQKRLDREIGALSDRRTNRSFHRATSSEESPQSSAGFRES